MIISNKTLKILILETDKVKTKPRLRLNNRTKIKVDQMKIQAQGRVVLRR